VAVGLDRVPGSFRDPSGFLFRLEGEVYRQVNPAFREHYELMMSSGFYQAAVDERLLIEHQEIDGLVGREPAHKVLKPIQLPFVSHPYEWSFSQLRDAALLTLELQELALKFGLCLKDASAYNVQFHRGAPIFIDSLSFEKHLEGRPWVAYQQFCRHFLAPLALMSYRHIELSKLLRVYIDGVPLELASLLLPFKTRLRPGLFLHLHVHSRMQQRYSDKTDAAKQAQSRQLSRTGLLGIVDGLKTAIHKLNWRPAGTEWASYYEETNYSDSARDEKARLVQQYLEEAAPSSVWDLGANTGFFSRLACDRAIPTVAFDVDPAAVEKNYLEVRKKGEEFILPLIMDLTNPSPDLGWNGEERSSLHRRGPVDLVMALALVHHLAISNNVPLEYVARFLRGICRSLIIEFVPKSDSQVQRLLSTREDIFPSYTREGFESAFSSCFRIRRASSIQDSDRILYLMDHRQESGGD
jgi:ribosomal protein L11 methylase PrmA